MCVSLFIRTARPPIRFQVRNIVLKKANWSKPVMIHVAIFFEKV